MFNINMKHCFFKLLIGMFYEKCATLKKGLGPRGSEGKKETFTEILTGLASRVQRRLIEVVFTSRPLFLQGEDARRFATFFPDEECLCRKGQKHLRH